MRTTCTGFVAALAIFLFSAASVQATPLLLTLADTPDIASGFIDASYDAGTQSFSANGFSFVLNNGANQSISGGSFDLTASIDNAGSLLGGNITIGGTIASLGFNSGTVLTGTLTALGFDSATDPLEFLFNVTGGDAAALYGASGGIILSNTNFSGSWSSGFVTNGTAVADAAIVSEPETLLLISAGLFLVVAARRRLLK